VADAVDYDLSEVRDLDYYTGITFEGFAPGLGFSLISGGRYDDLVGHFGPARPAVGWALTLDRLALAREIQRVDGGLQPVDALVAARPASSALGWAAEARRRGLRIEVDALGLTPAGLWAAAQERGLSRVVAFGDGTHLEVRDAAGVRRVELTDWEEVERWRRTG
jgi:ATP phosphoribosyltransferase regulatory subunit